MNRHDHVKADAFQVVAKPVGPICNLACKYCYYLEKENLYAGGTRWRMPDEVLEMFIRQKLESSDLSVENFVWQGGEPTLLGIEFFKKTVSLQKKYANGKKIENSFQTNGTLLNDEWCQFFSENEFLIGLSIDGPRGIHDQFRVTKSNEPSFDRVLRGIEVLKKHEVAFNTLTVLHRENASRPLELYHFLKEIGHGFMQFIPLVELISDQQFRENQHPIIDPDFDGNVTVSKRSVKPRQFGRFLCTVFDEWVRKDVGQYYVQTFENILSAWTGIEPSICIFSRTCGQSLVIEHNGDIYSCDHYVYPQYKLGNILQKDLYSIFNSPKQRKFGNKKWKALPKYCRVCHARFACNGECPKNRVLKAPDGEPGLNYLCEGYKMFFEHIDPYMQFMANELRNNKLPSNVMAWKNEKDLKRRLSKTGRNEPCPCGSGKKFKKCCGS